MTPDNKAVTPATDKWRIGYKDGHGPEYIVADDPKYGESAILTIRWGCSCCKDTIEKFDELTDKEQQIMREIVTAQSTIDQLKAENAALKTALDELLDWVNGERRTSDDRLAEIESMLPSKGEV